jgi:hypothetical protein
MANDHGVARCDLSDRLAVVWVAEDDRAVDESGVLRGKHVRGIVHELTTLTARKSVSDDKMM